MTRDDGAPAASTPTRGRRIAFGLIASALALALTLFVVELAGRVYAYQFAQRGKLFEPDAVLGWRVLPDLDLVRRNADGEPWRITTDADGGRTPHRFRPDAKTRVLVIGDSFAFGEGVDVDARFDRRLEARRPELGIVNLGVMGYGTDQELLAARPFLDDLRPGDVLLVLTASNDLFDLLKRSHSARNKPWAELGPDGPVFHAPQIGWLQQLRDRSYLFAWINARLEGDRTEFDADDLAASGRLYRALILSETEALRERGVRVVIAHHKLRRPWRPDLFAALDGTFAVVCQVRGVDCIRLDPALQREDGVERFLLDRHWNAAGHQTVADELARYFEPSGSDPSSRRVAPGR